MPDLIRHPEHTEISYFVKKNTTLFERWWSMGGEPG
jgi:hypothetical protein